ncbi:MAG: SDR family oxidoreductase [Chloroflexi bacterium]|nr:SDR family oxidoreductase [Chloroflexota bacterium]
MGTALAGKTAVVTGGGSGIGKAIASTFAAEGCKVVIAGRTESRLQTAALAIGKAGGTCIPVVADVSSEPQVVGLFKKAQSELGRIDLLVNNAGVTDGGPIDELKFETWRKVLSTNLDGVFLCTREAFKVMKAQGGGRIINIGSVSTAVPRPDAAPYSASKNAVWGLTKSTSIDGRPFGISCGQLNPGNIQVERFEPAFQPGETMIRPQDIAQAAVYMASLPPDAFVLSMTVMPTRQKLVGRG